MTAQILVATTAAHLAQALEVRHVVFVVEQGVSPDAERDALDEDPRTVHALACDETGRAIGTGRLLAPHTDTGHGAGTGHGHMTQGSAHIGRLAVLPAYRGSGVGAALMAELERQAWLRFADGAEVAVELSAQDHAGAFYTRLGYRLHGAGYWDEGIWHRDAIKILGGPATS